MRRINATAAWQVIADAFQCAPAPYIYGERCYGICDAIDTLRHVRRISQKTARRMFRAVTRHPNYSKHYYIWPITKAGGQARALFCLEQILRVRCNPLKS